MPLTSRHDSFCPHLRRSLLGLLALSAMTGCDRFKERILGMGTPSTVAQSPIEADSLTSRRDSITRRNRAAHDSLEAMNAVRLATDSLTGGRNASPSATTGAASRVAGLAEPVAMVPQSRAQILGDSIANAQVDKINGQNRIAATGDTVRGLVKLDGSGAGSRPVLLSNGGKTTITLSGLGTDGLTQVLGSDVVVRGMRITPLDIVVSGFSVRAVNGIPTIDGRLVKSAGGWSIELSDKSGVRKLPAVPEALQAFEGARVWVAEETKNTVPQLYGVIARR